jgi:hypothetical protein
MSYISEQYINVLEFQYIIMDEECCQDVPNCCDMRGMLSFMILWLLTKKPMHGQMIANEIEKRKGIKPTPGTIYPALKNLNKKVDY